MYNYCFYSSPLGEIRLESSEEALTGCWFSGQKHEKSLRGYENPENRILKEAKCWLNSYFIGNFKTIPFVMCPEGSDFRKKVWKILEQIPYGTVVTYSDIANLICAESGRGRMSAQAVGGAVSHNPISIFIPCHRVVGCSGELTGYAGGIDRKKDLLLLEKQNIETITKGDGQIHKVRITSQKCSINLPG